MRRAPILLLTFLCVSCSSSDYSWHPQLAATKGNLIPIVKRASTLGALRMLIPGESPGGEIIVTNQREFAPFLGEPPDNVFADQLAAFGDKDDLAASFVELTLLHHGDKTALGKNDEYVGAIGALHESPGSIVFNVWPAAGLLPGSDACRLYYVHGAVENLGGAVGAATDGKFDYVLLEGARENLHLQIAVAGSIKLSPELEALGPFERWERTHSMEGHPIDVASDWTQEPLRRLIAANEALALGVCDLHH